MKLLGFGLILFGVAGSAFAGIVTVPEIDGGTAVPAITVVAGSLLILRARRKK